MTFEKKRKKRRKGESKTMKKGRKWQPGGGSPTMDMKSETGYDMIGQNSFW